MIFFIVTAVAFLTIVAARIVFGAWFNHVSLYTGIWCGAMVLFEFRLINYYRLETETWIMIVGCWLIFLLGAFTVALARKAGEIGPRKDHDLSERISDVDELRRVRNALWILNVLTFAAGLHDLYIVSQIFGSLSKAFVLGNLLYTYRVSEGLPGSIPYVSSLVFTAATLAGNLTARIGRLTVAAIMPVIIIIMIDFAYMGRFDILVVAVLFASAYFLTPKVSSTKAQADRSGLKKFATVLVLVGIFVGGAEFIRSTRGAKERFTGSTRSLQKLSTASVITPSIYLYLSSDYGVLNKYLHAEGENTPIGANTFLPVYRILERIGLEVHAQTFQGWYRTPVRTNTGTYLRELHADFGMAGLLLGPYLLGIFASIYWFKVKTHGRYLDVAVACFLFGMIGMSFFVMPTRVSPFFFYPMVSIIVGFAVERKRPCRVKPAIEGARK